MAAHELYDYFTGTVAADYTAATLNISPNEVLVEEGEKKQTVLRGDDRSEIVIRLSDDSDFFVRLKWLKLTAADAGTIFDFYHDTAKANQFARSIKWLHPHDGYTYTVKFASELRRPVYPSGRFDIAELRLHVLGVSP